MCEPTTIALAVSAAAGLYGAKQADDARKDAKEAAKKQAAENEKQMAEMNKPKPTMVDPTLADKELASKKAKDRLRSGLFSTIKTSPLGTAPTAAPNLKTKLGQ